MPSQEHDRSSVLSVRLPDELIQRLDRYLDWRELHRRGKSSRNAALREALGNWLDDQEQLAGFLDPEAQRAQFHAAYRSVVNRHDWVPIHRLRQLLPWPPERFDTVLEDLRANHQVEVERAVSSELTPQAIQESYHVHGHLYSRLRWRT